ncbi:hypothetical protein EV685_3268 [Sphaerotilus mobilis]|uniref:Uncharacterized protein n=1 Tax=Sphaerotilus mobilis TaxID=47994 RepID=A0A4Q7LFW0_9BURK|nr:hypothetical protein EV685_3268 [Sphaerotilus mobilis]
MSVLNVPPGASNTVKVWRPIGTSPSDTGCPTYRLAKAFVFSHTAHDGARRSKTVLDAPGACPRSSPAPQPPIESAPR